MSKNLELCELLDFYGAVLTEKQRSVMEQYYHEDLSLAEIAENSGITRQGVRDAIKRAESTIMQLEHAVGFAQRHRAIQQSLDEFATLVNNIRFANREYAGMNPAIAAYTQELLSLIDRLEEL